MDYELISGLGNLVGSGLETLLKPLTQSFTDMAYFALIYDFLHDEINEFRDNVLGRATGTIGGIALVVMTIWIFFQALRIVTGQSRDSMMALVVNSLKATLIIAAATALGVTGSDLNDILIEDMQTSITQLVTGEEDTSPKEQIDENLAYMQLAMSSIDAVQVMNNDQMLYDRKMKALFMVGAGTAGPAMTGAAMLLLYEVAMALFIGFGPIFILCLLFDATKSLFQRWLLYGIGTMFSMAVLSAMVAIATKVVIAVAAAFWSTTLLSGLTGINFQNGFTSIAMQQGGIGLLLTVLLISTPPMAASFFQGTLGNFLYHSAVGSGPGMQTGQRPGESGYRGGPSPNSGGGHQSGGGNRGGGSGPPSYQGPQNSQQQQVNYNNPATNPNYGNTNTGAQNQQQGRLGAANQSSLGGGAGGGGGGGGGGSTNQTQLGGGSSVNRPQPMDPASVNSPQQRNDP